MSEQQPKDEMQKWLEQQRAELVAKAANETGEQLAFIEGEHWAYGQALEQYNSLAPQREQAAKALREAQAERDACRNLVALLNHDGGHRQVEVGMAQACQEAADEWAQILTARDSAEAALAEARQQLAATQEWAKDEQDKREQVENKLVDARQREAEAQAREDVLVEALNGAAAKRKQCCNCVTCEIGYFAAGLLATLPATACQRAERVQAMEAVISEAKAFVQWAEGVTREGNQLYDFSFNDCSELYEALDKLAALEAQP